MIKISKTRLDVLLFEKGLAPSRSVASAYIMEGKVYVDGVKITKAGEGIKEGSTVEVRTSLLRYVSRGGLKLEKALKIWSDIDLSGKVCLDIGASTGGFTDCMLQNGAGKVYAVDVGHNQLAWQLRNDPRVLCFEGVNARYLDESVVPEKCDFVCTDVSFISLRHILPVIYRFLKENGKSVCLIKPQFEAGKENVGKKGVVRDKSVHIDVINTVFSYAKEIGFTIEGLDYSPIRGPEGNIEYLMRLSKGGVCADIDTENTVLAAHSEFKGEEEAN